ncbi:DUF7352 domain-containing protein [Marinobacter sp. F4218]|uniref:DUF7352 domain-containing protein n=1 Tax=Marinobacter sp. F4218 TaxID=2862868 RepID=UPI001C62B9EE|nr:hypothetical protein [Marinobacter sp. F4218]MBW7469665.1 hypothetical protein [Marinobacter sp. F4218]
MKTIHKFRLEQGKAPTTLLLREGFRVVRCEYLVPDKSVYLWVEQPLSVGARNLERQFRVVFSGEPVPDDYVYLDTALDPFGPEAYHVFELPAVERELGISGADVLPGSNWRQTALS